MIVKNALHQELLLDMFHKCTFRGENIELAHELYREIKQASIIEEDECTNGPDR